MAEKRGRTGDEGKAAKLYGALATIIGIFWMCYLYLTATAGSVWSLPILMTFVGAIAFWIGRSTIRSAQS